MIYNYCTETDLKGFFPELSRYLWSGESDYSKQKQTAEQIFSADLINRGYKSVYMRPDLYLRTSTDVLTANETGVSYEDTVTRLRLCYNIISYTGTCSLVLEGSNDELTWSDITTVSITATGINSTVFVSAYKYYRVNATVGTNLAFKAWLTETNYDLFIQYKWLELIMWNASREAEDIYAQKALVLKQWYEDLWNNGLLNIDTNTDGIPDEQTEPVRFGR